MDGQESLAVAGLGPGRLEVHGGIGTALVETAFHLDEGPEMRWLNPYRILERGRLIGYARTTPVNEFVIDAGDAVVVWESLAGDGPGLTVRTRIVDDATVDTVVEVRPTAPLDDFEVLFSSYFTAWHAPEFATNRVWLNPDARPTWLTKTGREFEPTTWTRDARAAQVLLDGRYDEGHPPLWWTIGSRYHAPLMIQRHLRVAHSVVTMSRPDECFAISGLSEYHNSQYFHLFGRDLAPGEVATATVRMVALRGVDDVHAAAEESFARFLQV